ncbi:MAG TPA: tryptophan--tRNA ligase [Symbiobacteriaceae bacterium]|jgi:tryptophanyl-tRNA synthetase
MATKKTAKEIKRVFSGVQPSGSLTLGNYLGAIKNFVELQHQAECFFCVVDLHALTVPQEPKELRANTLNLARLYLAAGIDPDVATIFVQSHVSAHAEFGWLMECSTYVGELKRMTQFKDKSKKAEVVTTALFTYPALMAADILLYHASHVPVGEDQKQHLELSRDIATRINHRFNEEFLTVPEPYIASRKGGGRIMALTDPSKKMSKSLEDQNGNIYLLDSPDVIRNKIKRAVTDMGREVKYDEKNKPGVSNLMVLLSLCTGQSLDAISQKYDGYGQFKKDVAEAVVATLEPLQKRYAELSEPGVVEAILDKGAEKAEAVSMPTLRALQDRLGLVPRRRV